MFLTGLILKICTYFFPSKSNAKSSFTSLAPIDSADTTGSYRQALNRAVRDESVFNIALTGPYGSGKSSVIKTFLKTYDGKSVQISLAAFMIDANAETGSEKRKTADFEMNKQEIERSILQQLLYGVDANSLPLSRFKRIQSPKWWSHFASFVTIIGLFACWYLVQERADILNGKFFKPLDLTNWFNLICFAVGLLFLWQLAHRIYISSLGLSFKSISLKDIELIPETAKEESILNRHIDEIIYFFQRTKCDLVIIEDLDRFNNPNIFITLREINGLINANTCIKKKVRFLYALRDDMFENVDRTKFFEFIIPVVPIINSLNSSDKMIEQSRRLEIQDYLDKQFLLEISRYLNDLRLIHNIFNEYLIYDANLNATSIGSNGTSVLDHNKLLAILIYKNVIPDDFEALHRERGNLARILKKRDELIIRTETKIRNQISELETNILGADKQLPIDISELRSIYAIALLKLLPPNCRSIAHENRHIIINQIADDEDFEEIIEKSTVKFNLQNNPSLRTIDISNLPASISNGQSYVERKIEIERKTSKFKSETSKSIQELRKKITEVRMSKFSDLVRKNIDETEKLFNAFDEHKDLIKYLVLEGYLDDNYYLYTSLFHSIRLSPRDDNFLKQIRSYKTPGPDFRIDNPKEVIATMREEDFRQSFILNKTLIDCLFTNQIKYSEELSSFAEFVSTNFKDCEEFFRAYYETGKHVAKLLSVLSQNWPSFLSACIRSDQSDLHLANIIAHLPFSQLQKLHENEPDLPAFLSGNLSRILALGHEFPPENLANISFEIENLESIESFPVVMEIIVNRGKYKISKKNLDFIFVNILGIEEVELSNIHKAHYTFVLASRNEGLLDRLEKDLATYLREVLLKTGENTEENEESILKIIKNEEIPFELLIKFIEKQSTKINSLEDVPGHIYSTLFALNKIKATWYNCLSYLTHKAFESDKFTHFLQDKQVLHDLEQIPFDDVSDYPKLWQFLINNNDLADENYRRYTALIPQSFESIPDSVSNEKLELLVKLNKIDLSHTNFLRLSHDLGLQIELVANNITQYLTDPNQLNVDDDFRESLLETQIDDEDKIKVIDLMELSGLEDMPNRASLIGSIFSRTNTLLDQYSAEICTSLIIYAEPVEVQITLFNNSSRKFSSDQIWSIISRLPKPYCNIESGYLSYYIPDTALNVRFVEILKRRKIISSWKKGLFGKEIQIYPFRKKKS